MYWKIQSASIQMQLKITVQWRQINYVKESGFFCDYKTTNYLCNDISIKLCVNTENKAVEADWFTSVDYKTITPARNEAAVSI